MKKLSIRSYIITFIALMTFWFIMSGYFDLTHSIMGIISVGVVIAVNYQLKKHKYFEDEGDVLEVLRMGRLIVYMFWLAWQILISGFQIARVILTPSLPIEPSMIRFKVDLPNAHAKMILGNSITLTPGTLTVDIHEDEFMVHAIIPEAYKGIIDDRMPQEVLKLFTKEIHPVVSDITIISDKENL